ncbi:sensor histidine kinase [Robinsoniella peoriensis]|uniref:Sensor histidine kinase YpdA n=1 Tax=Robinsoniella peoriensis TaxID=180332 RepID=A0A4U8Q7M0_9FIRM|nr:sensor histidine kinase [Robinsoniella peoriensis]TLD00827.1 Sensor histidine kinase YpdA [Robinsoniella peoriensis]
MKNYWIKFSNLKIKQKLLISNIGIILIMVCLTGVSGYYISRNLLITTSVKSSVDLMEQLSSNFDYAIESLEDFILMQTFNKDFSGIIGKETEKGNSKALFDRKKKLLNFSYNLMNFNKYIKAVLVQDNFENIYYYSTDYSSMSLEEQDDNLAFQKAYEMWGTTYWKPYNEELVFASSLVFDFESMKPLGVISIGIDTAYFKELYKNISSEKANEILVLNQDRQILIGEDNKGRELAEIILEKYKPINEEGKEIYYNNEKYIYTTWKAKGNGIQVMNLISEKVIMDGIFKLLTPVIWSALLGVILSAAIAVLISGQISSNIKLLLTNIRSISKGDFSQKIVPASYDEVGMLAVEFNHMSEQIVQLFKSVTDEKIQKKNSELKALQFEYDSLQAKINPHFLYNTLESINSLAKLKGQQDIADSIFLLGKYLREAISSKRKFVLLEEEIQNIRNYVKIQQLSYGDKIQIIFHVDEALLDVVVPKLILQPLVENSIVHGIEPKIGKGRIEITARCEKKDMYLVVWDDGVGISREQLENTMEHKPGNSGYEHTKVGLMAVHKRIRILYGEAYGIHIHSSPQEGTSIMIKLPINFEDEEVHYEI